MRLLHAVGVGMVWLEGSVVVGVGSGGNGKLMGGRGSSPSSED